MTTILTACESKAQKVVKQHQEEAISRTSIPPELQAVLSKQNKPAS